MTTPETEGQSSFTSAFGTGPYVKAALFCEKVLREADGVLTFVRMIDRVNVEAMGPDAPTEMPSTPFTLHNVVILSAGSALGRHELAIAPELPSGQLHTPIVSMSVNFDGGPERAVNILGQFTMNFQVEGLYWFNVYLDDKLITRIPLRVSYRRISTGPATPASPQP